MSDYHFNSLHSWLYSANGSTLQEITDELRGLRGLNGNEAYADLPGDAGELLGGLMDLERMGLAVCESGKWFWKEKVERKPEALLF